MSVSVDNRKWVLATRPEGVFNPEVDVKLIKEEIDLTAIADDEVLVRVGMLSVDAFIRTMLDKEAYHGSVDIGNLIPAIGYGTVVKCGTSIKGLKEGDLVSGMMGAQQYTLSKQEGLMKNVLPRILPGVTPSMSLGLLNLTTGLTAYTGMFYVCSPPKKGETVVVSAAAGAVGSVAAQLAKISGARVVGIAGGEKKTQYLMQDLALDACIDYKNTKISFEDQLKAACPDGVDFFYDNVGGNTLDAVMNSINPKGRVVICGAISQYSGNLNKGKVQGPSSYLKLAEKGATMKGFNVMQHMRSLPKAIFWVWWYKIRGMLALTEHTEYGIDSFPSALGKLFSGGHIGKMLVDVEKEAAQECAPVK